MQLLKRINSYILIIIGALLASFSVACILLPNDAIDYGTAGIGIIISKLTGLSLSLCVFAVFIPFLVAGIFFLGKRFFFKALLGSLIYTLGLEFFDEIPFTVYTEHFLAVAFGGAILGLGLSLILRSGGCIDGSEILANIIVSKRSDRNGGNIGMTGILLAFNLCVYLAAFVVVNRDGAMMSILVYFIATTIINNFTDRFEAVKKVSIITQTPDELVIRIKEELNKTCTMVNSIGAISGENTTLICYVTYFELTRLKEILFDYKDSAFITVSTIDEIFSNR